MNTNHKAIKVLCFGDSNTWGQTPHKRSRYAVDVRWTGQLQNLLGDNYYIVEEGLGSRTTDLEYARKPGRNGKSYLQPCLESHNPIDVVILMLGTNDLKIEFNRSVADIAQALKGLVEMIQSLGVNAKGKAPKVILVSPILVDDTKPTFKELYDPEFYNHESAVKSQQLAEQVQVVAEQTGCTFVDASKVADPGEDGIHMDEASHTKLGELLAGKVKELA